MNNVSFLKIYSVLISYLLSLPNDQVAFLQITP